jgi:hypothetical protein
MAALSAGGKQLPPVVWLLGANLLHGMEYARQLVVPNNGGSAALLVCGE